MRLHTHLPQIPQSVTFTMTSVGSRRLGMGTSDSWMACLPLKVRASIIVAAGTATQGCDVAGRRLATGSSES
jgi:hypothetical protein